MAFHWRTYSGPRFDANWEVDLKCIVLYNYNCEVKAHLAAVNIYNVLFLNINGCGYIIL